MLAAACQPHCYTAAGTHAHRGSGSYVRRARVPSSLARPQAVHCGGGQGAGTESLALAFTTAPPAVTLRLSSGGDSLGHDIHRWGDRMWLFSAMAARFETEYSLVMLVMGEIALDGRQRSFCFWPGYSCFLQKKFVPSPQSLTYFPPTHWGHTRLPHAEHRVQLAAAAKGTCTCGGQLLLAGAHAHIL